MPGISLSRTAIGLGSKGQSWQQYWTTRSAFKSGDADATGVTCGHNASRLNAVDGSQFKGDGTVYFTVTGLLTTDTITAQSTGVPTCTVNDRLDVANGDEVFMVTVTRNDVVWAKYSCSEGSGGMLFDISGNGHHAYGVGTFTAVHWTAQQTKFYLHEKGHSYTLSTLTADSMGLNSLISANENIEIEVVGRFTVVTAGTYMFGCESSTCNTRFGIVGTNWYSAFGNKTANTGAADTKFHVFKYNKVGLYIDGTLTHSFAGYTFGAVDNVIGFFGLKRAVVINLNASCEIANIKISVNGTVVRNMFPHGGNTLSMYDTVSSTNILSNGGVATRRIIPALETGLTDPFALPLRSTQDGKSIIQGASYKFTTETTLINADKRLFSFFFDQDGAARTKKGSDIPRVGYDGLYFNGSNSLTILKRYSVISSTAKAQIYETIGETEAPLSLRFKYVGGMQFTPTLKYPATKRIRFDWGDGTFTEKMGADASNVVFTSAYAIANGYYGTRISGDIDSLTAFLLDDDLIVGDVTKLKLATNMATLMLRYGPYTMTNATPMPAGWKNAAIDISFCRSGYKFIDLLLNEVSALTSGAVTGSLVGTSSNERRTAASDDAVTNLTNNGYTFTNTPAKNTIAYADIESKRILSTSSPYFAAEGCEGIIHPSVLDLGSAWHGYRYWYAVTSYPNGEALYEYPCLYASNDAVNWVTPSGVVNPFVAFPEGGSGSDCDLYFENDKLYCTWGQPSNSFRLIESVDGVTWTDNQRIVYTAGEGLGDTTIVSPCLIKIGTKYYIYYLNKDAIAQTLRRRSADSIYGPYTDVEDITGMTKPVGKDWWHLDVVKIGEKYYMVVNQSYEVLAGTYGEAIYIGSSDDGVAFTRSTYPLIQLTEHYENYFYRPNLVVINGQLKCFYSVKCYKHFLDYPNPIGWRTAEIDVTLI